jgi:hypothetical protein
MKRITLYTGNYGSGKTELSIHTAIDMARRLRTKEETDYQGITLVDFDIVNPYFRSSEQKKLLEEHGVKLLGPSYALNSVDIPSLPPEIASVFVDRNSRVIFDVGGDPVGATALGAYSKRIQDEDYEMLMVVNICRPMTGDAESIVRMAEDIMTNSRLVISGLVNNANIARETTAEQLLQGQEILARVTEKTGIPVRFVSGMQQVLNAFVKQTGYDGSIVPIELVIRPDWLDM